MDKTKFEEVVSRLTEGQLIEIVQEDPSGVGFFKDDKTGEKQVIRQPYYFARRTNISTNQSGISVTSNKNEVTKRLEPAYHSIPYNKILELIPH